MAFLDTSHKRKSAVMTSIIAVLILILMFLFGLTYLDPPEEFGIAVNFGTTDYGSGNIQPTEALKPASEAPEESEPIEEPVEEIVEEMSEEVQEEVAESAAAEEEAAEEVITQANEEAIAIKKKEDAKKREEEVKKKKEAEAIAEAKRQAEAKRKAEAERQAEIERKRVAEAKRIAEEKAAQEAKRRSADAILGGFSDGNGKAEGGEGDDNKAGDKGKVTGDPNASGYYGIGGDGSGGNYRLGNRTALTKPKPDYPCNEEGKVVVKITVDRSGKVIVAEPGAQGTTNSASCLLTEAKEAALKTKFNADSKAPEKQIGAIIYNFSLSE
jgi:colicin import membrane protein